MLNKIKCLVARLMMKMGVIKSCKAKPLPACMMQKTCKKNCSKKCKK
jgi:hypothetical protein